jgi:uncharacterized membrane protein YdbT with pleckstrin-like domain
MSDRNEVNENEVKTREAFVLIAFRLFWTQLLIGITYFMLIEWLGFVNQEIVLGRLWLFAGLQSLQILLSLYFFMRWFNRYYYVSDREVVCHQGIFNQNSDFYSLERLESANLKQSFLGLVFNYGTIKISIHHSDHRDTILIRNIPKPKKKIKILEKNLREKANEKYA